MRYRSKIGIFWIVTILFLIWTNYMLFSKVDSFDWVFWLTLAIMGGVDFLFISVTFDTWYKFNTNNIEIKCGVLCHINIPYKDIVRFKETRNPLSSIGLSTDRLSILFKAQNGGNGNDEVLISPIRKQEFIKVLEEKSFKNITIKKCKMEL